VIFFFDGSSNPFRAQASYQFSNNFSQSVGLLGRAISPSQGRYLNTGQHKHRINAHRHPCLEWDSNPRYQLPSERRQFMLWAARLP
jgi:hypothetical protein